jgi:hypothetical protein
MLGEAKYLLRAEASKKQVFHFAQDDNFLIETADVRKHLNAPVSFRG